MFSAWIAGAVTTERDQLTVLDSRVGSVFFRLKRLPAGRVGFASGPGKCSTDEQIKTLNICAEPMKERRAESDGMSFTHGQSTGACAADLESKVSSGLQCDSPY